MQKKNVKKKYGDSHGCYSKIDKSVGSYFTPANKMNNNSLRPFQLP